VNSGFRHKMNAADLEAGNARFVDQSRNMNTAASAAMVNRTHRVIRERAGKIQVRRSKVRSLWIPLSVCATLLAALSFALWTAFEEYEASPAGVADTSQMLVLLMWSVPISIMLLAIVWTRRSGTGSGSSENERAR